MRSDQQVKLSQQDSNDPNSFFYFTSNAVKGRNNGLELEQEMRLSSAVDLFGSVGYLSTHIDRYPFPTKDGIVELGDREAAHAPGYTARLGATYRNRRGLVAGVEATAVDEFFFSDSHDEKSDPYQLFNGRVGFQRDAWGISLWGRNLLDERYAVRGFYFDNNPIDEVKRRYVSYGDPRQVGVTVKTSFFDSARR